MITQKYFTHENDSPNQEEENHPIYSEINAKPL
jgi:hypothetical protein